MRKILLMGTLLLTVLSCGTGDKKEVKNEKKEEIIIVSAAASLKKSLDEIAENYKKENPDVVLNINYGGSGTLEKQIAEGAPVDLFISAAKKNMDNLDGKNLIVKESRKDLLKNTLVLIVPNTHKEKIEKLDDVKKAEKIALGELATVPAGKYGKQALEKLNFWKEVEKKAVFQKDVTAVLNIVELGEVDAGIVYATDAKKAKNSFVAGEFPSDSHDPIVYPAAVVTAAKNKEGAEKFLKYLESEKAKEIFTKNGFKF